MTVRPKKSQASKPASAAAPSRQSVSEAAPLVDDALMRRTAGLRLTKARLAALAIAAPAPGPPSSRSASPPPRSPPPVSPPASPSVSPPASPSASLGEVPTPTPTPPASSPASAPGETVVSSASATGPASPASPSYDSDESADAFVIRLRRASARANARSSDDSPSAGASSPAPSRSAPITAAESGLFDEDADDEDGSDDVVDVCRPVSHPFDLPPPPAFHPASTRKNHYDPAAEWDYSRKAIIKFLQDVVGEAPHRCYLVEWAGRPLQLSWVWEEELAEHQLMMQQVDRWKASGDSRPFMKYYKKYFAADTASEAGLCFMDAIRAACFQLKVRNLVTLQIWDAFEEAYQEDMTNGVRRRDATAFFEYLGRESVPFDCERLKENLLRHSVTNVVELTNFAQTLPVGVYLASARQDSVGHCFVFVVRGAEDALKDGHGVVVALDGYNENQTPPVGPEPLLHLKWICEVKWVAAVLLRPGYQCRHGKRKSKTQKARERKIKLMKEQ